MKVGFVLSAKKYWPRGFYSVIARALFRYRQLTHHQFHIQMRYRIMQDVIAVIINEVNLRVAGFVLCTVSNFKGVQNATS